MSEVAVSEVKKSEGFNGWTNWETWLTNLWIDNDGYAGGSLGVSEEADRIVKGKLDNDDAFGDSISELAEWLKEAIDNDLNEHNGTLAGLLADIVNDFIKTVDWREIAEHYCEEAHYAASLAED